MRFSVRRRLQNALFRRVRFSSPGQTSGRLTERRSLYRPPHGETHFAQPAGCRMRFSVRHGCVMRFSVAPRPQNAPFRRVRFSSPGQTSGRLTERRSLCRPPHGKTHFAQPAGCRMRFSVRHGLQDVSFRNSRLGCRRQGWPLLSVGSAAVQPQGELRKV